MFWYLGHNFGDILVAGSPQRCSMEQLVVIRAVHGALGRDLAATLESFLARFVDAVPSKRVDNNVFIDDFRGVCFFRRLL